MQDADGSIGRFSLGVGKKISYEDKEKSERISEEETFKKLSRVSFEEMVRIMGEWRDHSVPLNGPNDIELFLNLHKWTYKEYLDEMLKRDGIY